MVKDVRCCSARRARRIRGFNPHKNPHKPIQQVDIGITFGWSLHLHPYFVYASIEVWCITSDKITDFH